MNTRITKRAIVMAAGMLVVASGAALGQDMGSSTTTITANVGALGSRTVVASPVAALTSSIGSETISGSLLVTVTEAVRTGTNPWSVTAVLDGDLVSGENTITADNLALSPGAVTQVSGGGTPAAGAGGALDAAKTLFDVAGQSTSLIYSGTYAQTSGLELTVPAGSTTGTYTADLTVTLIQ